MSVDFSGEGDNPTPKADPEVDGKNPSNNEVVFEHNGRKYTAADLANKLEASEGHIKNLETENGKFSEMMEKVLPALEKQSSMQEILEKVQSKLNERKEEPHVEEKPVVEQPKAVDADDITKRVLDNLSAAEKTKQQTANWQDVTVKLKKAFNDKVNAVVAERAAENGLSVDAAADLAKNNPKLFLKMFPEVTSPRAVGSPLGKSSSNSRSFQTQDEGPKPSGYGQAKGAKERIQIYRQRLEELGVG